MSGVYFVKTVHQYQSYTDYWRLVELSGYPIIDYDAVNVDSDNAYIFTPLSAEWERRWDRPVKATIILWDLEWRLKESSYDWGESALTKPPFVSRVWASDQWYAERIGAQYVPLGSHAGLVGTAQTDQTFDVALMSYIWGRRQTAVNALREAGLTIAPNAWDAERDAILKASHVILHIHQHERVHTVAPLRFALAAAYHKPLISETVQECGVFNKAVLYADYEELDGYTAMMIRRYPQLLRHKADELHDMLCISNSFRSYVEKAL
jgi:hypothetical protein